MSSTNTTTCDKCGKVTRVVNLEATGTSWDVAMHGSDPFKENASGMKTSRWRFASWDFCEDHAREAYALLSGYAAPHHDDTELA